MEKIAIVGLSCLLPGSKTPQDYYASLLDNKCFLAKPNLPTVDLTHFTDIALPEHLANLDPVFTNTLYVAYEALRDSGYLQNKKVLGRTGIIMGARETCNPQLFDLFAPVYLAELESNIQKLLRNKNFKFDYQPSQPTGSALNVFYFSYPTRVAAEILKLQGVSFAIDAACSSSLYSIKLAIHYLLSKQTDLMLAGGLLSGFNADEHQYYFSALGVSAENNQSRALCGESKGIVTNDGGGVIALKRLSDAQKDQDKIYAVIDAMGWLNECGKGKLLLAPSRKGQTQTYKQTFDALTEQQITPKDIDYIECHATGTIVGDKIELDTLGAFYAEQDAAHVPLFGSVKNNIGHLLSGSGVAALIKVIYSLNEGTIPATYDVKSALESKNGKFSKKNLVSTNVAWPDRQVVDSTGSASNKLRRAAISCFGFGGSHAHLIVSEYRADKRTVVKKTAPYKAEAMTVVGVGVQAGSLSGVGAFTQALQQARSPATGYATGRLRGVDENEILQQKYFLKEKSTEDYYFPSFDFDYFKNGIKPSARGEGLNKELLLLKVVDEACEEAGFIYGEQRRVGVIISAEQVLFQVQLYLEYSLKKMIESALSTSGMQLETHEIEDLIKVARDAVVRTNNGGFSFLATTIGPIISSRITSSWGFNGPTFKMSALENSFIRSIELARHLLQFENLEAVVIAAVDNDPALESRIWYRHYGQAIGFDVQGMALGDGAAAIVLTQNKKIAMQSGKQYAQISAVDFYPVPAVADAGLTVQTAVVDKETVAVCLEKHAVRKMPLHYVEFFAAGGNNALLQFKHVFNAAYQDATKGMSAAKSPELGSALLNFGYSFTATAALSIVKAIAVLHQKILPLEKNGEIERCAHADPGQPVGDVLVFGLGFDGTLSCVYLSEVLVLELPSPTDIEQAALQLFKYQGSVIKQVSNKFATIKSVMLAEENLRKFAQTCVAKPEDVQEAEKQLPAAKTSSAQPASSSGNAATTKSEIASAALHQQPMQTQVNDDIVTDNKYKEFLTEYFKNNSSIQENFYQNQELLTSLIDKKLFDTKSDQRKELDDNNGSATGAKEKDT